ncbi:MAG: hypothetical protein AB7N76_26015 [Planctomycetota bacterium]
MSREHGADVIVGWVSDLVRLARSGLEVHTAGGAQPDRSYAYLAYTTPEDRHSVLLFSLELGAGEPALVAQRIDGSGDEVQERLRELRLPVVLDA